MTPPARAIRGQDGDSSPLYPLSAALAVHYLAIVAVLHAMPDVAVWTVKPNVQPLARDIVSALGNTLYGEGKCIRPVADLPATIVRFVDTLARQVQGQTAALPFLNHGCAIPNSDAGIADAISIRQCGVSSPALSLNRFVQVAVNAMEGHAALPFGS